MGSRKIFFCRDPGGESKSTSMRNLEYVAKKWLSYCTRYERVHFAVVGVGEVEKHIFFK